MPNSTILTDPRNIAHGRVIFNFVP